MSQLPKNNTLFKCTTSLSINERFTQLRGFTGQATVRHARETTVRENNALIHQASIKNRRLAQQMERRPTVMAALKIKKKSIRQRLGPLDNGSSVQDRLLLSVPSEGVRIRGRARGRGRGLLRGRMGAQGHVSVLASPRGIRSFGQRNRGGALLRQPQRSSEVRQQRSELLNQLRANHLVGGQQLRRGLRGSRLQLGQQREGGLRGQLRGSGLRGQLRGGSLRGSGLRGRGLLRSGLRGTGLRGTGLRGTGLRGTGLRGTGLRGTGLRGTGLRGTGLRETGGYRGVRRGQVVLQRDLVRGGQLRRNLHGGGFEQRGRGFEHRGRGFEQRGRGFEQRGRGVRGRLQRSRGNQQSNQRVSFRGFGRNQPNQPKPSKEELDNELDQYMSNSESHLDHQIDSYMSYDASNSWH